jgi:NitT/TauT family transport system ATP-binding protein
LVEVDRLHKSFQEEAPPVLKDVTFSVPKSGSLAIVGPSGCGKTTLLYILSGLLAPSSGSVRVNDWKATKPSGKTGFILQDFGLLP